MSTAIQESAARIQNKFFVAGIAGLSLTLVAFAMNPRQFFESYLIAYIFWAGIALGSLALLFIHQLTSGAWGHALRGFLEAAAGTLPWVALLFIPLGFGLHYLYPWTDVEASHHLGHKLHYLNSTWFLVRAAGYFLIWNGLAFFFKKWTNEERSHGDIPHSVRLQVLSGAGLVLFGLTVTFASVDWAMSLIPEWYSTIYGLLVMVGWALSSLAFAIACASRADQRKTLNYFTRDNFHDFGNLLLAFVMLWAYLTLSQFLIVWSANLPEEITWYLDRLKNGWQGVGIFLAVFYFVMPFFLLLVRNNKRNAVSLGRIAKLVFLMQFAHLLWLIIPSFQESRGIRLFDLAAWIGLGGIWLWAFAGRLKTKDFPIPALTVSKGGH